MKAYRTCFSSFSYESKYLSLKSPIQEIVSFVYISSCFIFEPNMMVLYGGVGSYVWVVSVEPIFSPNQIGVLFANLNFYFMKTASFVCLLLT